MRDWTSQMTGIIYGMKILYLNQQENNSVLKLAITGFSKSQ